MINQMLSIQRSYSNSLTDAWNNSSVADRVVLTIVMGAFSLLLWAGIVNRLRKGYKAYVELNTSKAQAFVLQTLGPIRPPRDVKMKGEMDPSFAHLPYFEFQDDDTGTLYQGRFHFDSGKCTGRGKMIKTVQGIKQVTEGVFKDGKLVQRT